MPPSAHHRLGGGAPTAAAGLRKPLGSSPLNIMCTWPVSAMSQSRRSFFRTQRGSAVSAGCASKGCRADPNSFPCRRLTHWYFIGSFPRDYGPGLAPGVATRFRSRGFRCRPSRPILCRPSPRLPVVPARRPGLSRRVRRARLRRSSALATRRLPSRCRPRGPGRQARAPRRQRQQTISRPLGRRRATSHRRVTDRPMVQARTPA